MQTEREHRLIAKQRRRTLELDVIRQVPPAQKLAAHGHSYLHAFVCFACRKSFKRASQTKAVLPCPHCSGPSIGLTRKFKVPKQSDIRQWTKVEALVRNGFLFWGQIGPYPETLREVPAFITSNAWFVHEERRRKPAHYAEIDAAFVEMARRASL